MALIACIRIVVVFFIFQLWMGDITEAFLKGNSSQLVWTHTNPAQWYSRSDLCVINHWKNGTQLSDFSSNVCKGPSKDNEADGQISVGYGSSYFATCRPPLVDHPHYSQALQGSVIIVLINPYILLLIFDIRSQASTIQDLWSCCTHFMKYIHRIVQLCFSAIQCPDFHISPSWTSLND